MTTYTAINATETQSGKPITESLMTRFANNLVAVTEGDPSSPPFKGRVTVNELFEVTSGSSGALSTTITVNNTTGSSLEAIVIAAGADGLSGGKRVGVQVDGTIQGVSLSSYIIPITLSPGNNSVTISCNPADSLQGAIIGVQP